MPRGFILQPTYRVERGRPVVHLHGRLEDGAPFLVRETRQRPRFWIRRTDAAAAARLGAGLVPEEPPRQTLHGEAAARVETERPSQVPPLRDRLHAAGIRTFEADVRYALRLLMDHGIRGSLIMEGAPRPGPAATPPEPAAPGSGPPHPLAAPRIFDDPRIAPGDWAPSTLRVLSLDIETDPRARQLLSVALCGCGAEEVLLLTPGKLPCPPGARPFPDEGALLDGLVQRVLELDPDVLTGWNVVDFDLAVLLRVAGRTGRTLALGRDGEPVRLRAGASPRAASQATVAGRLIMDGIGLLRGAFVRMESYALDAVAREVLGRGKTLAGPHRAADILAAFRADRPRFVAYNLNDALLVLEILSRLQLVELAVERSRLTGLPPDRVAASIAAFDFLYLSELGRRRRVAPTVDPSAVAGQEQAGGHVLEPLPGLHRNVLVLDFRSLYPSIMRTFQIDPVGHVPDPAPGQDLIRAPNGAAFRREPGILPGLLDDLFPRREAAQRAGNRVASQAIKILMNSFYGVLGTPACRFASPALANAITGFGREILLWTRDRMEARGRPVLYGDTDSLFVDSGEEDDAAARRLGERLAADLTAELAEHVRQRWRVESRLELQFERLYLRLLLPSVRHGTVGARKRYAGLVADGKATRVVFTGMESVRRDWTELARRLQEELYRRLFTDAPVEDYLRSVVAALRRGELDGQLVYRKGLRKDLADYTATTPPHVAAARKMSRPPGAVITYVMTTAGPEPAGERQAPLDHEHYVQRQIRPVAEPILALLDRDFDAVIGDESQLKLF